LSVERGAPLRLVIPQLYTWEGPKWVRGWNYLTHEAQHLGFWEERGYDLRGDAWREQRFRRQDEVPVSGTAVPVGGLSPAPRYWKRTVPSAPPNQSLRSTLNPSDSRSSLASS